MLTPDYARLMARYNSWQNTNLYGCAARLSDEQRKAERGAFFGSIHATLNHILWADMLWLSRFGVGEPPPAGKINDGLAMFAGFEALQTARKTVDQRIVDWADGLTPGDLAGDLHFHSASFGQSLVRPRAVVAVQIFNHQTHHRGQVHAMLTGYGVTPEPTDVPMNAALWEGLFE